MNKIRPIHPDEIIKQKYLEPLGMNVNSLAIALRVPVFRMNDIVRQKRAIISYVGLRRLWVRYEPQQMIDKTTNA